MMKVDIDSRSGFCGGVIRAISRAEGFLSGHPDKCLFSLGDIVHNEAELARLQAAGLVTIDNDDLDEMESVHGATLLIRAHGEPPVTYEKAAGTGFEIIDCTCPVVLNIQKDIREAYARTRKDGGQILIFGKTGHPEVLGLVGQTGGDAVVVENVTQLEEALASGRIDAGRPVDIFSQTTMSPEGYAAACGMLRSRMAPGAELTVHDTICSQVASRHRLLSEFAAGHDIILFVSGSNSSNGKVLCELCRSVNARTYHIGGPEDINTGWFRKDDRVGVCGATSTPKWLLEEVAAHVENLQ